MDDEQLKRLRSKIMGRTIADVRHVFTDEPRGTMLVLDDETILFLGTVDMARWRATLQETPPANG